MYAHAKEKLSKKNQKMEKHVLVDYYLQMKI